MVAEKDTPVTVPLQIQSNCVVGVVTIVWSYKDSSIEEDDDRFPEDMAGKSEWYDETYMYQEVAMNYS